MSEEGELWKAWREDKQQKRAKNTLSSTETLKSYDIRFETKNQGAHLIVENKFDFWPSTGLFRNRQTNKKGRGVFRLIEELKC